MLILWFTEVAFIMATFSAIAAAFQQTLSTAPAPTHHSRPRFTAPQAKIRHVVRRSVPRVVVGYRDKWVPGRPLEECFGPDKELNENVLRCRNGYSRKVPIYNR